MKRFFSHLPACVEASACGIWRASASISVMACSAVVIELPNGVFITITPLAVAAGMSTLSTPMPARPTTRSFLAFSSSFAVTLVAERMARPSKSPIISASLSLSAPSLGWKSTSTPRSLKICTAASESASEMSTRGDIAKLPVFIRCRPRESGDPYSRGRCVGAMGPRLRGDDSKSHAAFASASLVPAKAQSSHSVSASMSGVSTVAPHQMRKPGGASR